MGNELALVCIATGVSAFICLKAVPIGRCLGVLDKPDDVRKLHTHVTPQIGGVAVLTGLLLWIVASSVLGLSQDTAQVNAVLFCGAGVALVGLTDDQKALSPHGRLAFLIVFVLIALALDREMVVLEIHSQIFDKVGVPLVVYYGLILVAALGIVNAVNMADGQDGIAAGMFAIWTACLVFQTTGTSRSIAAVMHMLCLVFLFFNLRPKGKVFLGDCGSYGITFIIGLLVILAHARAQLNIEAIIVWFFIPVVDCLRLLVMRLKNGTSPFRADRQHFHHRLQDRLGKNWGLAAYLGSVGTTSIISTVAPHWAPVCLCILTGFYFGLAFRRPAKHAVEIEARANGLRGENVISLNGDRERGAA